MCVGRPQSLSGQQGHVPDANETLSVLCAANAGTGDWLGGCHGRDRMDPSVPSPRSLSPALLSPSLPLNLADDQLCGSNGGGEQRDREAPRHRQHSGLDPSSKRVRALITAFVVMTHLPWPPRRRSSFSPPPLPLRPLQACCPRRSFGTWRWRSGSPPERACVCVCEEKRVRTGQQSDRALDRALDRDYIGRWIGRHLEHGVSDAFGHGLHTEVQHRHVRPRRDELSNPPSGGW